MELEISMELEILIITNWKTWETSLIPPHYGMNNNQRPSDKTKYVEQLVKGGQPFAGRGDGSPCHQQVAAATSFTWQPAAIVRQVNGDNKQHADDTNESQVSDREGKNFLKV